MLYSELSQGPEPVGVRQALPIGGVTQILWPTCSEPARWLWSSEVFLVSELNWKVSCPFLKNKQKKKTLLERLRGEINYSFIWPTMQKFPASKQQNEQKKQKKHQLK